MRIFIFSLIFLFSTLIVSPLYAAKLRIVDSRGLTRVVSEIKKPSSIAVMVSGDAGEITLVLKDLDGVNAPIAGVGKADKEVILPGVSPGVWELSLKPSNARLKMIRVVKE